METDYTLAIIAIVLGLIALIGVAYVYVDTPEPTDLSGVESDIINIDRKITNLGKDIDNIDTDCKCDVDQDDIEDLEDDIDDLQDDVNDLDNRIDDIEDDSSQELEDLAEYFRCLNEATDYDDIADCINNYLD